MSVASFRTLRTAVNSRKCIAPNRRLLSSSAVRRAEEAAPAQTPNVGTLPRPRPPVGSFRGGYVETLSSLTTSN